MWIIIFSFLIIALAGYVIYVLLGEQKAAETGRLIEDSFAAWKNNEFKETRFEVEHDKTSVTKMFETFPSARQGYLTLEEINETVSDLTPTYLRKKFSETAL